jgi:hypothetical protein
VAAQLAVSEEGFSSLSKYIFMYSLFLDAAGSSEYTTSNGRMVAEY